MPRRRAHILSVAVALPALALGLAACSAKSTPPGPPNGNSTGATGSTGTTGAATSTQGCNGGSAGKSTTIDISNFTFLTCPDTVSPGASITVNNQDTVTHTLTEIQPTAEGFNTGNIGPNSTKTFTAPTKAGTYYYDCSIHPYMLGVLIVT
ncbi:MAG: cupredoxin domain-containing protein [Acidimicrobiales bacterium]